MAEAGKARLAFGQLANWPQTLVTPIERVMVLGTMLIGAYLAMNDTSGYMVGGLFAFMMLASGSPSRWSAWRGWSKTTRRSARRSARRRRSSTGRSRAVRPPSA